MEVHELQRIRNSEALIVDDSETQSDCLRRLLESNGFRVRASSNGTCALASIRQSRPDLVITNAEVPELNGYDLCRALKNDQALKAIPVILLSPLSSPADLIRGLKCGADALIRTPYDEQHLICRVFNTLSNLQTHIENEPVSTSTEIKVADQDYRAASDRRQILDLLLSMYEESAHATRKLEASKRQLLASNQWLARLRRMAERLNACSTESEVADAAIEWAVDLLGVSLSWFIASEPNSSVRILAVRGSDGLRSNLPPSPVCQCRSNATQLNQPAIERGCALIERLGLGHNFFHLIVPIWTSRDTFGTFCMIGSDDSFLETSHLDALYSVGNQIGIALERSRLYLHLEKEVEEKTASLTNEVAIRTLAQEQLRKAQSDLEDRVKDRTTELLLANSALKREIVDRKEAQDERDRLLALETAARNELELAVRGRDDAILALERSEQDYRYLAETVPAMVWTASADGMLEYFNQHCLEYVGKTADEMRAVWRGPDVIHPDDLAVVQRWDEAVRLGIPFECESRVRRFDGAYRWHLVRALPVSNSTEGIVKWFGTCTDVDDIRSAQENIRRFNIELEQRVSERTAELNHSREELSRSLGRKGSSA